MRVDEAKDGSEALERVAAELPDLIFMDIHMPGINGLELTRLLKSAERMGTIVILTTHDLPEYREAAEATGADYFIVKGTADQEEITGLVRSIMEKPGD
jgi:CheY-like chemotaxis protein